MKVNKPENQVSISNEEILSTISILEALVNDTSLLGEFTIDERKSLLIAAGKLSRPDKHETKRRGKEIRKALKKAVTQHDRGVRAKTGIRSARTTDVFAAPLQISKTSESFFKTAGELKSPRACYVCLAPFKVLHHFYDSMCMSCADLNYKKRFQTASLKGQVALITGSRLKIGYHATLMMLRAGAQVIATTRFPKDSALRYAKESDFQDWGHRLQIYGLDLRHTPSVEIFARYIEQKYERLDLLLNNAAQTVRRPPKFYQHLMENENRSIASFSETEQMLLSDHLSCTQQLNEFCGPQNDSEKALPVVWHGQGPGVGIRASAQLSQIPYTYDDSLQVSEIFPEGKLDADLQQVDLRKVNSWRLKIGEIQTSEMLEVQLVNSVAPFVLCNILTPMMKKDFTGQKHIVNVTAMEGKFQRFKKEARHPHTNMAKAALNMLTNTMSGELAKEGIFVNAVDTGWVTDEDPMHLAKLKEDIHDFQPPLDIVDGAARICDPFFDGILTGKHWSGKFLKDYRPIDW
jgi:NAD(P)-dependent dehydrogenase (short-subunit alcohol dehydrogenase family)